MKDNAFANRFKLVFSNMNYTDLENQISSLTIPGITGGQLIYHTPIRPMVYPGDSLEIFDMNVSFRLDEEYDTWLKLFEWITFNKSTKEIDMHLFMTDINILIHNSKFNPIFNIKLTDCFPFSISDLPLDVTIDSAEVINFDCMFKVNDMEIERVI